MAMPDAAISAANNQASCLRPVAPTIVSSICLLAVHGVLRSWKAAERSYETFYSVPNAWFIQIV